MVVLWAVVRGACGVWFELVFAHLLFFPLFIVIRIRLLGLIRYDEIETFGGYGKDQTFRHLPIRSESIRVGDSLTFVCTFSSMDMQRPIHYGVSHGDEMCAPLILYYPHVRGPKGQTNINMIGFTNTKTKADDVKSSDIQLQDLI